MLMDVATEGSTAAQLSVTEPWPLARVAATSRVGTVSPPEASTDVTS